MVKLRRYKTIFLLGIFFGIFFTVLTPAYGQSVGLNLVLASQSVLDHNVPIDLAITSNVFINQAKIQWILPYGVTTTFGEKTSYTTSLANTETYQDHFVIVPQYAGTFIVTANVSGIYNDGQFNKSGTLYLTFDNHLHLTNVVSKDPTTGITNIDTYTIKRSLYIAVGIGLFIVFVIMMKDVYNYIRMKFISWLNKDSSL